jgi:ribonuclease VapC
MTVVNLGEVIYRTIRERGLEQAQEVLARIREFRIEIVEINQELALAAAYLKGLHPISYADCFAAALAQQLDAAVVTGDPDFQQLEGRVAIEWLPAAET